MRSFGWRLVLLLTLGGALRMGWILYTQDAFVPYTDSVRMIWMARAHLGSVPVTAPDFHHPLFPWWLAGSFFIFGDSLLVARIACAVPLLLALLPICLWTRSVFSERAALWTAAVGTILPSLISASLEVFDVNLAALFLAAALWTQLLPRPFLRGFLGGVIVGLGYLTRPEFPVFGVGLAVAALLRAVPAGERRSSRVAAEWTALLLGFLLLAGPYLVRTRIIHKRWMVSPKSEAVLHGMGASGGGAHWVTRVGRMTLHNAYYYTRALLPLAIPISLWWAVAFGACWRSGGHRRARDAWPVVASFALTFPVTLEPSFRFLVVVLPLLLPWLARGLEWTWGVARAQTAARTALVVACVVGLAPQVYDLSKRRGSFGMEWAEELKAAGRWVRDHSPATARIGFGRSTAVFYAERRMAPIARLEAVSDFAALKALYAATGARYVILSERSAAEEKAFAGVYRSREGRVFQRGCGTGHGVAVYDLTQEAGH